MSFNWLGSPNCFFQCADFICEHNNPTLTGMWRYRHQRKHVVSNNVFLSSGELKIFARILKCARRMPKTVQPMAWISLMPIVEKIIVEKCSADKCVAIYR